MPALEREVAPDEARAVSERLLIIYREAAAASDPPPAEDRDRLRRLQERIHYLEQLSVP